jgi:ubiquinone/menaquinone biosynthesis C-methylase UbiE
MQRWVKLAEVMQTGEPAGHAHAPRQGDELRAFICGMADISRASSAEVAAKHDLSPHRRLLDVGGGPGTAAITFARANPRLRCVVFDLPDVLEIAGAEIAEAGLQDRVTTRPGDFLTDELGGGDDLFDLIYVSNIIHSLGPEAVEALFAKCRRAATRGGTIIVKDFYLDETRTRPEAAARFSVNMLLGTRAGRSYTLGETRAMLAQTGFGGFRDLPLAKASALLIGTAS